MSGDSKSDSCSSGCGHFIIPLWPPRIYVSHSFCTKTWTKPQTNPHSLRSINPELHVASWELKVHALSTEHGLKMGHEWIEGKLQCLLQRNLKSPWILFSLGHSHCGRMDSSLLKDTVLKFWTGEVDQSLCRVMDLKMTSMTLESGHSMDMLNGGSIPVQELIVSVCHSSLQGFHAPSHSIGSSQKKPFVLGFWVMHGNKLEIEIATLRNEGITFSPNTTPVLDWGHRNDLSDCPDLSTLSA